MSFLLPVRGLEDALDVALLELVDAVRLDDLVHADEGLLERVEGRRVDHLLLDLCRVRAPRHEEEFGAVAGLRALGFHRVVVVVDGVAAVVVVAVFHLQVAQELFVAVVAVTRLILSKKTRY